MLVNGLESEGMTYRFVILSRDQQTTSCWFGANLLTKDITGSRDLNGVELSLANPFFYLFQRDLDINSCGCRYQVSIS